MNSDPSSTFERVRSLVLQAAHLGDRPSTRFLLREKVSPADVRELMAVLGEVDDFIVRLPYDLSPEDQAGTVEAVFHRLDQLECSDGEGLPLEEAVRLYDLAIKMQVFSLEGERLADIPPRRWWAFFTIGLNLAISKKGLGKTAFLFDVVYAMGGTFMGRPVPRARVLLIETELDRLSVHERTMARGPAPEGVDVLYEFPRGDEAVLYLEALVATFGYEVVIVDMLQSILPIDMETNSYDSGHYFLSLRRLAQRLGFILIATWHSTKATRDDWLDQAMGSTALVSQADVIVSLERDRGASTGKLRTCGNHGNEQVLSVSFEGGRWGLVGEDQPEAPRVPEGEREILASLEAAPAGLMAKEIAETIGKPPANVRAWLSRMGARGLVVKIEGRWFKRNETKQTDIFTHVSEGQPDARAQRNATASIERPCVVARAGDPTWDDLAPEED